MSTKTKRIISIVLMVIPSLMIVMSGIMKLIGAEQVVQGLTKIEIKSGRLFFSSSKSMDLKIESEMKIYQCNQLQRLIRSNFYFFFLEEILITIRQIY